VVSIRGASDAGISDHAGDLAIGTATATTTSGIGAHPDSLLAGCLVHVVAPSWARRAAGKAAALFSIQRLHPDRCVYIGCVDAERIDGNGRVSSAGATTLLTPWPDEFRRAVAPGCTEAR
jgi:hypothetical protein